MSEHPIIFTGESVKAILDGRKSQTRRVIRPQPPQEHTIASCHYSKTGWAISELNKDGTLGGCKCSGGQVICPYGEVGDLLWVRETWRTSKAIQLKKVTQKIIYRANEPDDIRLFFKWKSPRFMFKKFARIWLEITGIRVERVQEISIEDCFAEGVNTQQASHAQPFFKELWDSINGKKYPWKDNVWVWVIEFKEGKQ